MDTNRLPNNFQPVGGKRQRTSPLPLLDISGSYNGSDSFLPSGGASLLDSLNFNAGSTQPNLPSQDSQTAPWTPWQSPDFLTDFFAETSTTQANQDSTKKIYTLPRTGSSAPFFQSDPFAPTGASSFHLNLFGPSAASSFQSDPFGPSAASSIQSDPFGPTGSSSFQLEPFRPTAASSSIQRFSRQSFMNPFAPGPVAGSSRNIGFSPPAAVPAVQLSFELPKWTPETARQPSYLQSKIWGLTCDKQTNHVYFSDRMSHTITCMEPDGRVLFQIPRFHADGRLHRPTGIAFDDYYRRLVVCDKDNHRISLFAADGHYISSFGTFGHGNGMFNYPWDVAVSPTGRDIAVADSRNKRIQLFDNCGKFTGKFSVFERFPFEYKNNFDYPRGITFDLTGKRIYTTDFNAQNIIEIPTELNIYKKLVPDGKLRRPQGIHVDSFGGLLVADSRNNCIRHVTPEGDLVATIRAIGAENIEYPVNVAGLSGGHVGFLDGHGKFHVV